MQTPWGELHGFDEQAVTSVLSHCKPRNPSAQAQAVAPFILKQVPPFCKEILHKLAIQS